MKIKENSENYTIELINGFYTIVCRSPYGARCMKVVKGLSSKDLKEVQLMWKGYKATALQTGRFKK